MADPVRDNGSIPPPPLWAPSALTDVVEHLDLRDLMLERGTTGLKRAGGYIREEPLSELAGQAGIRKFGEMKNTSPVIGACLYAIEMRMRQVRWTFEPADATPEAQYYADLAHGMLFDDLDMPWSMLLSEILSFLPFGFSYFEVIYKRRQGQDPPPNPDGSRPLPSLFDDGYIGIGKIAPRAQDTVLRWEFDQTGSLRGLHQLDPYMGRQAYIPYEKALLFRPTSYKDSPEGRSILRTAYEAYYMVSHIQRTEAIGIERDLTGLPVLGTPPQWWSASASPEDVAKLEMVKHIGRNIRQDEQSCFVYPLIYDHNNNPLLTFTLASSPGSKAIDTDTIIQRYELRMTQSVLCDLLFLGHEDTGSFALASSKSTTETVALGGYNTVIKDEVNRRLMPKVWRYNAFPEAKRPTFTHGDVESLDLTELARFMLSFGRVFNMQDLENHIRSMAGLPERPDAATHPLPPSIQPHGASSSHGGGSGSDIEEVGASPPGSAGGLPGLDGDLSSQSLGL
jgi:hypothetical protein